MRSTAFIILLFLSFSCTAKTKAAVTSNNLNGTWKPVKEDMGGIVLPNMAFESQKLIINDSNYTFIAESTDKGIVRYSNDKMDIYGKDGVNTGKHYTAIYKYENGELTICYNLAGNSYPEAFATKGQPLFLLCVFKKQQP